MSTNQFSNTSQPLRLRVLTGLRCIQLILAIAIASLYGTLLASEKSTETSISKISIFAEVVAVLSVATCALSFFMTIGSVAWCICDGSAFVLWTTLFGTSFTTMRYIGRVRSEGRASGYLNDSEFAKLQTVVYMNFFISFLWLGTTIQGILSLYLAKKRAHNMEEAKKRPDLEAREVFDD
ncbi:hypothetical protein CDV36_009947 [Fusarium kuroshium]|uniref:MARVEL domain-containing protein n=1 Tax=Fusarium kuroshium TaxID=2010991 RepID=A0A3M2RZF4_9HYPO|nr:hypothetical protein CDV36_009947 [Fusarium kuroshium]